MASLNKILLAGAVPIGTPGLSHFDRILGQALGGREVEKTATPGDIVTFTTNLAKPLTSLKVLITATQSGTGDPSPTNIRPITGWTGCTVTRTGKNLFDKSAIVFPSGTTIEYTQIAVKDGTYTMSTNFPNNSTKDVFFIRGYATSGASSQYNGVDIENPRTVASLDGYITVAFRYNSSRENPADYNYQVELGSTATTYAPYTGQTYTTAFGDAGTVYGGTLDVLTGELTVDKVLATYTGADVEGWALTSQGTALYKAQPLIWRANMTPICNRYLGVAPGASSSIGNLKCRLSATYSNFIVRDDDLLDVDAFKASLALNPMQVVFRLATPQTYQLTPQAVDALLGENVVFADTGAVSELKYLVKE